MSILDKVGGMLGGGLGGKIADLIGARMENKSEALKLTHEITMALGQRAHEIDMALVAREEKIALAQAEVNKVEAASDSLFKSGWRPAIGWVCAFALGYQMIGRPMLAWLSTMNAWMPPPSLEMDTLLTLLFAILGLGAYRTYEKTQR